MSERETAVTGTGEGDGRALGKHRVDALTRLIRAVVLRRLGAIRRGRLTLMDPLGRTSFGAAAPGDPETLVRIRDLSAYLDVARAGTIGAAEAYMQGKWTVSDLLGLVRIFVINRDMMDNVEGGIARASVPFLKLAHWLRRNTERQSRRNIRSHYDLGNELYRLFLDTTMSYSAAVYPHPEATLEEAAVHKLELICRKLDLRAGDHLLEIGTGWGGLAIHAARHFGCRVTTTTISRLQRDYALARVTEAGLADRVTVLDEDYRKLDGQYEKLVSVEMIEAVGLDNLDRYFRLCSERLKPHGRMLLQSIVVADHLYERTRRSVDFIQKYIFPGGALPSLAAIQGAVARMTDVQLVHLHDIGADYARTLREWRHRFMSQLPAVRRLGYSEEFIRMWEYYLAYCEGGFLERAISDVQLVFDKPGCRLAAIA
jgi:cyclopropane-fatty-acyl-phospholipid synthase